MKRLLLILSPFLFSCTGNHYHDGRYSASTKLYKVSVNIDGNEINVKNSLTGESHFNCTQLADRIEYTENNGTVRILRVNENKDLVINESTVLTKD